MLMCCFLVFFLSLSWPLLAIDFQGICRDTAIKNLEIQVESLINVSPEIE